MRSRLLVRVAVPIVLLAGAMWWLSSRPQVIYLGPDDPVSDLIAAAPEGAVIRLSPGEYPPFDVVRRVSVIGGSKVIVRGPIVVLADGVRISDLLVRGGESGVILRDADDVVLERLEVMGARLHGIEIAPGSAVVRDCVIGDLVSPYGQGLEVRNSSGRPHTIVDGCRIWSGQEGIVSHASRVEFRNNVVSGTSLRGIVVTEMSEGAVEDNQVLDVRGSAIYCGDMSHCEVRENRIARVSEAPGAGASYAGWGTLGFYHSTIHVADNIVTGASAGAFRTAMDAHVAAQSPLLLWPAGVGGLWPGLAISVAAATLCLSLVALMVTPLVRRRNERFQGTRDSHPSDVAVAVVATVVAVQAFHMLEHTVQVWQVYVAASAERSGLVGQVVDTEWVHFGYNLAVMAFMGWLTIDVWRGRWGWSSGVARPAAFLAASTLIQAYHMTEHTAKIVQYLVAGVDPAPGIFGSRLGLVWFHFGINLAVFAGLVIGAAPLLRRGRVSASAAPEAIPARE